MRAWSHSLFEVFIKMSSIFSKWKKVNKYSPKQMMGESRWHNTKPKEQCITILHTWRARDVLSFMFPLLWEVLRGQDHKTKKLIARNVRAWSHSLFEVLIHMSRTFSQWKRVNKNCHSKHMMGESRWHKLENQKNNTEQSCRLEEPDTVSIYVSFVMGVAVAKTKKPKN